MELTKEQQYVLNESMKFKKKVQKIGGYAGTGKTTLISSLINKIPNFAVCAFTGKAASVLKKKGIENASTIHSLIYQPVLDERGNIITDKNGSPIFEKKKLLEYEGILVDEASTVSKELDEDLRSFNLPIIYVGDHGQLEPVGEAIDLMKSPDYTLEEIHRNAGIIAHFAEHIRKGKKPVYFDTGSSNKIEFISKHQILDSINDVDQIICAFNKTRVRMNEIARKIKGFPSGDWPSVGEKLICLRNCKTSGLFNGMQGHIERFFDKPKNKFCFVNENGDKFEVLFDPNTFNQEKYEFSSRKEDPHPFEFGYAITCHKSQGSEWDTTMVIEEKCKNWDHIRWAYTAATRARTKIYWAS